MGQFSIPDLILARQTAWTAKDGLPRDYVYPGRPAPLSLVPSRAAILKDGIDQSAMSFPAVISTADLDRTHDIVVPEGCLLEQYALNPTVLFNHQQTDAVPFPIGQARSPDGVLQVWIEAGKEVISRCFIAQKGRWAETAADIFHLVVEGVLNGVSIGFDPIPEAAERLPEGGHRFNAWHLLEWSGVLIGANQFATVIRKYLSDGRITGKRIEPMLIKALEPLAAPINTSAAKPAASNLPAKVTTAHTLSNASTGARAMAIAKPKKKSTSFAKIVAAALKRGYLKRRKAMGESAGPTGGYTAPAQDEHGRIKAAIADVAEKHKAVEGEQEQFHYHADAMKCYHQHSMDAKPEHLGQVKADLEKIPGLKSVEQGSEAPAGEGWEKCMKDEPSAASETDEPQSGEMEIKEKRRQYKRQFWANCEKRGLSDAKTERLWLKHQKDMEDMAGADDASDPMGDGEADDLETVDMPHGAQLASLLIETIEGMLGSAEPECREHFEQSLANELKWAEERYPDVDFAGEEDTISPEQELEGEEETEELMDRYHAARADRLKRFAVYRKCNEMLTPGKKHLKSIRKAADWADEVADDPEVPKEHRKSAWGHFKALDLAHTEMSDGSKKPDEDEEETETEPKKKAEEAPKDADKPADKTAEDEEKGLDFAAIMAELGTVSAVSKRQASDIYAVTGRR